MSPSYPHPSERPEIVYMNKKCEREKEPKRFSSKVGLKA